MRRACTDVRRRRPRGVPRVPASGGPEHPDGLADHQRFVRKGSAIRDPLQSVAGGIRTSRHADGTWHHRLLHGRARGPLRDAGCDVVTVQWFDISMDSHPSRTVIAVSDPKAGVPRQLPTSDLTSL